MINYIPSQYFNPPSHSVPGKNVNIRLVCNDQYIVYCLSSGLSDDIYNSNHLLKGII